MFRLLLISALLAATTTLAHAGELTAAQQESVLTEATDAYARGLSLRSTDPGKAKAAFARAVDRFSVLLDDGIVNGPLLYDLGNAQVQAGRIGAGIATYLRAETLIPGDPRLQENLNHARSLVRTKVRPRGADALLDRMLFWHSAWSSTTRLGLFIGAWCVLWAVLIIRLWRPLPLARTTATASGLAAAALGLSLAAPTLLIGAPQGVLVQDDVIVRKGDDEGFAPRFEEPIHQGVEFRVLETRPQWLHIELLDGQDGWVPRDAAHVIGRASSPASTAVAAA